MDIPTFAELDRRGLAAGLSRSRMAKKLNMPLSTYYRLVDEMTEQPAVLERQRRHTEFQRLVEAAEAENVDQLP